MVRICKSSFMGTAHNLMHSIDQYTDSYIDNMTLYYQVYID